MPNRILKESITTSETLDMLTADEERFFYRLVVVADDYGRFDARPNIIIGRCFPLKIGRVTEKAISRWLTRLEDVGLLRCYAVDGRPYLQLVTWLKHQPSRAKSSKYPDPPGDDGGDDEAKSPQIQGDDGSEQGVIADDSECEQTLADASKCPRIRIRNSYSINENRGAGGDNGADAPVPLSLVRELFDYYKSNIQPDSRIRLTDRARQKIQTRLRSFSLDDLKAGIDHFKAHDWYLKNCADEGPAWFFDNDERSQKFLNLKPRAPTPNGTAPTIQRRQAMRVEDLP